MAYAKDIFPNGYCNGDIGYCSYLGHTAAILVRWKDDTVVSVDCEHDRCHLSKYCELYQRTPVGYTKTYPE